MKPPLSRRTFFKRAGAAAVGSLAAPAAANDFASACHNALPLSDAAMVNDLARLHLVAAQFSFNPPLLAHDESVLIAADIEPGKVLRSPLSGNGKLLLQRLRPRE